MKRKIALMSVLILSIAVLQALAFAADKFNPLATGDQLAAEELVKYIVATDEVQAAVAEAKTYWLSIAPATTTDQMTYLDAAVNEEAYFAALQAICNDPNYPKLISVIARPHDWFGLDIPGSRFTFDNPDTIYWMAGIDPTASYVIKGRHNKKRPVDENFAVQQANWSAVATIPGSALVTEADGSFTITIDPNPANGRVNHLQTTSAATYVFVRNTIGNWARQTPDSLTIERVGTPSSTPKTLQDMIDETAGLLANHNLSPTSKSVLYTRMAQTPVNQMPAPGRNANFTTQAQTYSYWSIADDEALIVKVNLGGAKYFTCPVYNMWMTTTDWVSHTQSLNNAQAKPNGNGTYTFIISKTDPHVYNWIDTAGMNDGTLNLRWQGIPSTVPATGDVSATMTGPVKVADLKTLLPNFARNQHVNKAQRAQQLKERAKAFARRYATLSPW